MILEKTNSAILNLDQFTRYLLGLRNGFYEVSIKRQRGRNSAKQRGWLWGAIYPMLLTALVDAGWEITSVEEVHEFFKKLFANHKVVNRFTGEIIEIPDSTALMNTVEYASYCEKLREYALEYLGIDIGEPDPDWKEKEVLHTKPEIDYSQCAVNQFGEI